MALSLFVKSDDSYLFTKLWIPKKSRGEGLVFCHGWGGQAQYDDLLALLADQGYYALRLDQRGYGESTGEADLSLWAHDMVVCAKALKGEVGRVWAAGQSTGGAMSLIAAAAHECFAGAVSMAPFLSLEGIIRDNSNARTILEGRFGPLQEKHFRAVDTLNITRKLRKPVFIIHGTADQSVPFAHGTLIHRQLESNAQFLAVDGANHHLTNVNRSPVFQEIIGWLGRQSNRDG
ncbi:MAG: alpha/beta hydrolase family protein [Candidatus Binatia bacterium]